MAIAALTAGLWWWLHRPAALQVESIAVPAPPVRIGCGQTAELQVRVGVNGAGGELRYQWVRSDGRRSAVLTERLARDQRHAVLTLRWRVIGPGRYSGAAVVRLLHPAGRVSPPARFEYRC